MASTSHTSPSSLSTISPPSSHPPLSPATHSLTIKLNRSNYLLWKAQILNIAIENGVDPLLDSSTPAPPKFLDSESLLPNSEFTTWMRYNRLIMSWMFSSMSEDLLPQIASFTTAGEIWDALARMLASSSLARITDLRSQLLSISKDGLSVVDYIQKITNLCNTLAEIGEPVSPKDRLMYFLSGLGSEYNEFVASVTTRADQPSSEEVHSLLQSFDFRLEKRHAALSLPAPNLLQADVALPPQLAANQHSGSSFSARCQICSKTGHSALNCSHRLNLSYRPAQVTHNLTHPHTNQPASQVSTHTACLAQSPQSTHPTNLPTHLDSTNQNPYPYPLESASLGLEPAPLPPSPGILPTPKLLDSGATNHVSPSLSSRQSPQPYFGPSAVDTADGLDFPSAASSRPSVIPGKPIVEKSPPICSKMEANKLKSTLLRQEQYPSGSGQEEQASRLDACLGAMNYVGANDVENGEPTFSRNLDHFRTDGGNNLTKQRKKTKFSDLVKIAYACLASNVEDSSFTHANNFGFNGQGIELKYTDLLQNSNWNSIPEWTSSDATSAKKIPQEDGKLVFQMQSLRRDCMRNDEKVKQDHTLASTSDDKSLKKNEELSQTGKDSSLAPVSTPVEQNHNPDKGLSNADNLIGTSVPNAKLAYRLHEKR